MNEETLEWLELERRKQNGTWEKWGLSFLTDGFYVRVSGGEESDSDPPSYMGHISEYKKVVVELYDRCEMPEHKEWEPMEVLGIQIKFETRIFPHKPILPIFDKRFQEQSWASKFNYSYGKTVGPSASLSLNELEAVMNYLVRIDGLAAFV